MESGKVMSVCVSEACPASAGSDPAWQILALIPRGGTALQKGIPV